LDIWDFLIRGLRNGNSNKHDEAIKEFSDAIRAIKDYGAVIPLNPHFLLAFFGRGNSWREKKEYEKAIKDFDEAIRLDPKSATAFFCRGEAWSDKKEYGKAIKDFDEAIRLFPEYDAAYDRLAWLLATCPDESVRDGKRAIQMATRACDMTGWVSGWELATLAAAYAEVGQFDEALRYQTKALEDPDCRGVDGDEFRQRLELYKQKKSFRQNT